MKLGDKTPTRLVQVSLFFSVTNLVLSGFSGSAFLLLLVFTLSVYSFAKVAVVLWSPRLQDQAAWDQLKFHFGVLAVIFITIATVGYSMLFAVFYLTLAVVYMISPYDRDWVSGDADIVLEGGQVHYKRVV
jgi:ABC-type phosphate transport system permease subunit